MDGAIHVSGLQIAMMIVSFVFIIAMMVVLLGRYRRDKDLSRTLIWGLVIFMGTNVFVTGFGLILNKSGWFMALHPLIQMLIYSLDLVIGYTLISAIVMHFFVKKSHSDRTPIIMALGFMLMHFFQTAMSLANFAVMSVAINKGDTAKFIGENVNAEAVQNTIDSIIAMKPMNYLDLIVSIYGDFIVYTVVLIILYRLFTARDKKMVFGFYSIAILLFYRLLIGISKYYISSVVIVILINLVAMSAIGYLGYKFYKKDF
ncbi:hypothetical protein GTU75_04525 [Erysipelothrix rhusiopathiae]|uniref:hypothetical protein n=1 Tax=unclassified Erysipelothrix TaxID=2624170 RepID=UPI001378A0C8|nr:hypothetical protein [Erysipelothrix sp. strain 2 (EsS2-7-Brazil)]MBK2403670.1 hypothetical protein [Erysipelothrix sp. strain 2 (EsS2-7-Brazil)]NBA01408.1 hypothetical protein [Erysipelothrix rhusiopathiae]